MNNIAIKLEHISKQYRLGTIGTGTLSHDLNRWWTMNILRKEDPFLKIGSVNDRSTKADSDYVWALNNINLEIKQGEVLGIIGKNGAGKSTLLKILSRVTSPSTGRITAYGRIASLLEVGTGFHLEMTGRENIFMNGSIMGMTKAEIRRKMDEIIDFAGIERYVDTPVKRYSSGMIVRLGFAIAAHLEPEILIVDEVLAVGDAEFQKKAIGKMQDISKEGGRTVLFVSHNMGAIQSLCKTGILLKDGLMQHRGLIKEVLEQYSTSLLLNNQDKELENRERNRIYPQKYSKLKSFEILGSSMKLTNDFFMKETMVFRIKLEILKPVNRFEVGIGIRNSIDVPVHFLTSSWAGELYTLDKGTHCFMVRIPEIILFPGIYTINCWTSIDGDYEYSDDNVFNIDTFTVHEYDLTGNFERLGLQNTFSRYASGNSLVYIESEWRQE